jgi:hypothetical protein
MPERGHGREDTWRFPRQLDRPTHCFASQSATSRHSVGVAPGWKNPK